MSTPPWWKTWWAYALYGVIFFGTLYGLWRYEMNRILWKNRVKIENLEAEKLRELDQFKSRFFANLSHEFRTPLTLILGPLERMLAASQDKKAQPELKLMRANAANLLRLVNQLLDLAKLESGTMRLQARQGDLMHCLKIIIAAFESLAQSRNMALRFHTPIESLEVWFNRDSLEKVFYNLLSNAFKFTPDGGEISVQVSVISNQSRLATDNWSLITVKDTGIGIPADKLPHVFDRFYQAESASTRKYEGTGIGLSLVKELVELHYGKIEIRSAEGKGTEVVVRLPLGREHLKAEEIVEASDQFSVISNQHSVTSDPASDKWQGASEKDFITPTIQPSSDPTIHQSSDPVIQ